MEDLVTRIKRHEGYKRWAYICPAGKLTIGYGTVIEAPGQGISKSIAEQMLKQRLLELREELIEIYPFESLSEIQQDSLIEMAYQLGVKGLMDFKRMWSALRASDWEDAYREALDSKWAQQTPKRAKTVAEGLRYGR